MGRPRKKSFMSAPVKRRKRNGPTREEENEIIREYQSTRSESSAEKILKLHERFCRMQAGIWATRAGMDADDLAQEARMGLLHAAGKFNLTKDVRFLTYAGWWVLQYVQRYTQLNKTIQTRPANMDPRHKEVMDNYNKLMKKREKTHGITVLTESEKREIEKQLGHSLSKIHELRTLYYGDAQSLDDSVSSNDEVSLTGIEVLPDERPDPFELSIQSSESRFLCRLFNMAGLSMNERKTIELRYMSDGDEMKTLEEVGQELKLTRERIRQIEFAALKKLKAVARTQEHRLEASA